LTVRNCLTNYNLSLISFLKKTINLNDFENIYDYKKFTCDINIYIFLILINYYFKFLSQTINNICAGDDDVIMHINFLFL